MLGYQDSCTYDIASSFFLCLVVPLPSNQYSLELTNTSIGELVVDKSRVIGIDYGHTELHLLDSNTPIDHNVSADVYVVKPHHLGFHITGGNWNLEVGRQYALTVQVYDIKNHALFMSENLRLNTSIPEDYFDVFEKSDNGSYFFVRTKRSGHPRLLSSFNQLVHPRTGELYELNTVLTGSQLVDIYDPITVEPDPAVILWDPDREDGRMEDPYSYAMKALGGSGNYIWSSEENGVITINPEGVVHPLIKGSSSVQAADSRNSLHFGTAKVHVVPPAKLSFVTSRNRDDVGTRVEAVIGSSLTLPIQISAYLDEARQVLYPVLDCRRVMLKFRSTNQNCFNITMDTSVDLLSLPKGSCGAIRAVANAVGNTVVTATMETKIYGSLHASITIAAYPPLKVVDPPEIAVVTLGSSKTFVFQGGPAPWVRDPIHFYEKLESDPSLEKYITIHPMQGIGKQHFFRVSCLKLGDVDLKVTVGNGPSPTNPFPAEEEAQSQLSCSEPHSLKLKPKFDTKLDCPLLQSSSSNIQFPIISGHPLDLEMMVYDEKGRAFDNFTSLSFDWKSSNPDAVPLPNELDLHHHGNYAKMAVQLSEGSGSGSLTVSSNSYQADLKFLNKEKFTPISSRLSLLLQLPPQISPPSLLIFAQEQNKQLLTIRDGSGYFAVEHTAAVGVSKMADVEYSNGHHDITVTALQEGSFHIHVKDLCLDLGTRLTVEVHMSDLYTIDVQVPNKVQVGSTIVAVVKVMDGSGRSFPSSQFKHMNLVPYPKTAHIDVQSASEETLKRFSAAQLWDSAVFDVKGVSVGTTNLYFNATRRGGGVVTSSPNEIQVFSTLTLSPKEIWLVPEAIFQIHSSGGPSQSDIIFNTNDSSIAVVDDSGLIRAKMVGDAMVTGKAQAEDGVSGKLLIYSEDVVYVHVRKLTGIRISIPSTKLLAGNEVAVLAHGILSDDTPFEFGSSVPRISFSWSVTNMDSLSLVSVYEKSGVSLDEERDFAARLHTRNPGVGEIQLEARCPPGVCSPNEAVFTDRVQVQVLTKLTLKSPQNGYFLLPQYSSARIETNRDGIARMSYQLLLPDETDPNLIILTSLGQITTSGINGHAVVMVTSYESESSFNQSISIHVEVCPVSSLALTPPPSLPQATPNSKYHSFPLGYSAEFTADLHDNKGRKFSRSAINIKYRLNRNDIVRVLPGNNGSLSIQASQQGEAILRVWLRDHAHIDDYIRVRVGFAVTPNMATVHLGTKICFSTHLALEGYPGSWSSGDEAILRILDSSGVGQAVSPGKTVVYHSVPDVIDTRTEIYVGRLKEVVISELSRNVFTNAPNTSTYTIPITFIKNDDGPFTPINVIHQKSCLRALQIEEDNTVKSRFIQQVKFDCVLTMTSSRSGNMDALRYVSASPYFDPFTGSSSCVLTAADDLSTASDIASQDGLKLSVKVVAHDNENSYNVESGSAEVPFVPAFTVSASHITITSLEDRMTLAVSGIDRQLKQLQVTSSDSNLVRVDPVLSDVPPTRTYSVRFIGKVQDHPPVHVRVYSPFTQQAVIIPVTYQPVTIATDECPPETGPTGKQTTHAKMTPPTTTKKENQTGFSFLFPVLIGLGVGTIGLILALAAYGRSGKTSSQSGFQAYIPKASSPQSLTPIATPKGGSPNTSLINRSGFGGTPMVSMTTPTSSGSAFKGMSPSSTKGTTPTSVISRGVSPSTKYRSLYSQ